ncbi:hypothetical protein LWE61_04415 [Sphingobium sufflavum]|uniref:hypothetical protein n=1 Tax=Sphingobium sufflavum TaxID=1129547 RepID=UPI001F2AFAA6|nr:hypothetical protein [Sphingobium sufflavum]MCE7795800.1 hypothetical protein [Sphingobium sufflavum]
MTSDGARHPFRRGLPQHVTSGTEELRPIASSDNDWRLFLLSFTAFFIVAYSFIA